MGYVRQRGKFRDSFFCWASRSSSTTASVRIVGGQSSLIRHTTNEAFCKYLMILLFPNNEDLSDLFSCSSCTLQEENGSKIMEGVVMDGTALGILGRLPSFQRIICTVPIAKRIAVEQYIMRTPKITFL